MTAIVAEIVRGLRYLLMIVAYCVLIPILCVGLVIAYALAAVLYGSAGLLRLIIGRRGTAR